MPSPVGREPTDDQVATAIEWLRTYDDDGEGGSNGADCRAVADWLSAMLDNRALRRRAREYGVPIDKLRARLAAQTR